MAKNLNLSLTRNEVGQILDGLEVRAAAWERTAEYLRTGEMSADDVFIAEECRNEEEARAVAADYRRIMGKICRQLAETNEASPVGGHTDQRRAQRADGADPRQR